MDFKIVIFTKMHTVASKGKRKLTGLMRQT